ncbi:hypothetical protein B0H10DRAFT_413664 [Mycena sp. CBHHK59/15]|nr:hypothetical protein B0H10DRAFT_413664 [Mycena sp. CBHHK59/15]
MLTFTTPSLSQSDPVASMARSLSCCRQMSLRWPSLGTSSMIRWYISQLLSEASNFSVIVRPIMDDPIPKFIEAAAEQARLRSDHPPSKLPDDSGDPVVEHRDIVQGGNNTKTTSRRAVRIRGGAGSEEDLTEGKQRMGGRARPMPEWEGDYHTATVDLTLEMGQDTTYDTAFVQAFSSRCSRELGIQIMASPT